MHVQWVGARTTLAEHLFVAELAQMWIMNTGFAQELWMPLQRLSKTDVQGNLAYLFWQKALGAAALFYSFSCFILTAWYGSIRTSEGWMGRQASGKIFVLSDFWYLPKGQSPSTYNTLLRLFGVKHFEWPVWDNVHSTKLHWLRSVSAFRF